MKGRKVRSKGLAPAAAAPGSAILKPAVGGANKGAHRRKKSTLSGLAVAGTQSWEVRTIDTSPPPPVSTVDVEASPPSTPRAMPSTPGSLLKSCLKKSMARRTKRRSSESNLSITFSPKLVTGSGLTYSKHDYDRTYDMPVILACDSCGLYFRGTCFTCPKCPTGTCDICESCCG
mmetsp:Transcript_14522/g.42952  ORF Transcript_14522/g.42952 Transcript_14522/m.42952 type:complete len:175 (-) Transcript_14522:31-555(-)